MQFSWKDPLKALPVLLLLAAYAGAAFGAAGNVQFVIGDAKLITRAGVTRALQKGAEINEGDRVITAANASAQIKMVDGGFIAIRPSTDMGFDTYRYSGKEDGSESAIVSLLRGGFRTITGVIGRSNKQNYLIKTETATIGIRGTDHEPMVILPPAPGQVAIAEAGTYDKVNVGIAFIRTDAGSVDIQRNQVGFAPVTKAAPVILPRIPPFYKPTPAPGSQKAMVEAKDEGDKDGQTSAAAGAEKSGGQEQEAVPAEIRDTAAVDSSSSVAAAPAAASAAAALGAAPAVVAPVITTTSKDPSGNTVNFTTQTVTSSTGTQTPIDSTAPPATPITPGPVIQTLPAGNYLAAVMFPVATTGGFNEGFSPDNPLRPSTAYVLDGSANLIEARNLPFQVQSNQNGIVLTPSITSASGADIKWNGGTAADTFKLADNSIYAGRWVGSTVTVTDNSAPTNVYTYTPANSLWAVLLPPPVGYVQSLTGTTTFTMAGHTTPVDAFGNLGTLNSASLVANFTTQKADAAVNLTMGAGSMAGTFDLSATAMPIEAVTSINPSGFGVPNSGALAATCTGACAAGASGYSADIGGSFAGAAAASAGLSYNIWPTTTSTAPATNSLQGLVAFTAGGGTAAPTVAAYAPSNIEVEIAMPFFGSRWGTSLVAPADLIYAGGGLSSFTDKEIGGSKSHSYSVTGGSGPVTADANSLATTGVQFGRWTSATALQMIETGQLGIQPGGGGRATWIYGPQGYLDTAVVLGTNTGPLSGAFTYTLDGSTAPYDKQSGRSGTLSNAHINANFTNQTASAGVDLTVGGQAWSANTPNPISFGNGNAFSASSLPGTAIHNLTISMGTSTTPVACPTCFGSLSGAFTGQNYAGAILSYNLWDSGNAGGDVVGHAALVRGGAITNATSTTATGKYFVADYGGGVQSADTVTATGNLLTAYSSGSPTSGANGFYSTTVSCTTCTVTAATNATTSAAPTGVYFGTWDAGSYTNTWGGPLDMASPHWITGPEAGPLFLANALTGSKAFAFDGGMVTNGNGAPGTVLGTSALTVDFTRQVAGINIDLSINDTAPTPTLHTWTAKTSAGNEAVIDSGKGIGGAAFQASTGNASGRGLLTVTVDGVTPSNANGNVSGQLTGIGLNGAIMSFDFSAVMGASSPTFEQVNGVVALAGAASDVTTAHRAVMISATDPDSTISQPVLGMYANSPARTLADAAGNLTEFDMNKINNGNNGKGSVDASHTLSNGTSLLTDSGTDAATGISWGRWAGGNINITNRADATSKTQPLAGSLHWIAGPVETAAVTLPLSGTFSYVKAGNTLPTDNLGNIGVLNSATLTANFTAQTVDVGVQATIAGATLGGSASAVPIIQRTAFAAGPDMPVNLAVDCSGTCGTAHRGTIVGGFTGVGATGAAMMYSLEKIGANASITSGVVAFRR